MDQGGGVRDTVGVTYNRQFFFERHIKSNVPYVKNVLNVQNVLYAQ